MSEEAFPLLDKQTLTERARFWAENEKYNGHVVKISLHEYLGAEYPFRYVILFHFDVGLIHLSNEILDDVLQSTLKITKAPSFYSVYKDSNLPEDHTTEWVFWPLCEDDVIPPYFSTKSWQLYPAGVDRPPDEVGASPESETPPESQEDFVKRMRADECLKGKAAALSKTLKKDPKEIMDSIIAFKLRQYFGEHDRRGNHANIARELGYGKDLNPDQHDALKKRGRKLIKSGEDFLRDFPTFPAWENREK